VTQRRLLVSGDRDWTAVEPIRTLLESCAHDTVIIHGMARGADSIANKEAWRLGLRVDPYPADWRRYKRAAGPIRNTQMLQEGRPTEVHAFHDNLAHSTGTRDMVTKALAAELPVWLHDSSGGVVRLLPQPDS